MKLLNNFNVSREDGCPRKFSFELTMSGIVSLFVVGAIVIIWAFVLGVFLGRGYKPEDAVPELAEIMPTTQAPAPVEKAEEPTVLKPEDLQFMEKLQGKAKEGDMIVVESNQTQPDGAAPKAAAPAASGVQAYDLDKAQGPAVQTPAAAPAKQLAESDMKMKKESSEAKTAPKVEAKPAKAQTMSEPVEIATEEKAKPAASKPADPQSSSGAGGARFTATYQIASFYKKEQADTMIQKLTKNGLSPSIKEAEANGKKVYRVILSVTGTDEELSEAIKKTGEKGPMLLKKKPL